MKKLFITLMAVLGIYSYSQAQTKGSVEFGAFAGVGSSYVTSGANYNSKTLVGFNAGVSADYYFSDEWSVKVKPAFDQKGWDGYLIILYADGTNYNTNVNYNLNYINVPVLANWHFGRTKNWYLDFGPYVGFLMSAKTSNGGPYGDVKPYFSSTDAGLALGIGYKFPITEHTKFFVELNGQGGAMNISKAGSSLQNGKSDVSIGFNF